MILPNFSLTVLGDQFNISLQTNSEAESAGANTSKCSSFVGIAKRLNKENKGLNLTSSDATTFFAWCAYELNARGYSDICNIFTKDELVRFSYSQDLETYYQTGPGYDVVRSVGANLFNASVKLLKESEVQDQKVWLSFTHDTDILNYLTTIGIIDDKNNLTAEYVSHSWSSTFLTDPGTFLKVLVFTPKSSSVPTTLMLDTSYNERCCRSK
nr:AKR_HP1_G0022370.mRNA.1.CDS.1 [Saccharomyces cerevisiae]